VLLFPGTGLFVVFCRSLVVIAFFNPIPLIPLVNFIRLSRRLFDASVAIRYSAAASFSSSAAERAFGIVCVGGGLFWVVRPGFVGLFGWVGKAIGFGDEVALIGGGRFVESFGGRWVFEVLGGFVCFRRFGECDERRWVVVWKRGGLEMMLGELRGEKEFEWMD
jgi:hypothetical protein